MDFFFLYKPNVVCLYVTHWKTVLFWVSPTCEGKLVRFLQICVSKDQMALIWIQGRWQEKKQKEYLLGWGEPTNNPILIPLPLTNADVFYVWKA